MVTKTARGRIVTPGVVALTVEAQVAFEIGQPAHITGPYEVGLADGTRPVLGICSVANKKRVNTVNSTTVGVANAPGPITVEAFGFMVGCVAAGAQIDAGEPVGVAPGGLWVPRGSTGFTTGANEVQSVTEGGSGLVTYTLTFDGETTAAIAAAATNAQVQAALVALDNINVGDVAVTGSAGGPYTVTFSGRYAATNVPQMTATPTGGTGTVTVATVTPGTYTEPASVMNGIALTTADEIGDMIDVLFR